MCPLGFYNGLFLKNSSWVYGTQTSHFLYFLFVAACVYVRAPARLCIRVYVCAGTPTYGIYVRLCVASFIFLLHYLYFSQPPTHNQT